MKFSMLRDLFLVGCFMLLATLIVAKLDEGTQEKLAGKFFVVDGDSLGKDGRRLRLLGIDAPELSQTCSRSGTEWPCGRMARDELENLLTQGKVECTGGDSDRYGRLLVTCRTDAVNVNREMVRRGYAVAFGAYDDDQAAAKKDGRGLWSGSFVPPSDWRRSHRVEIGDGTPHEPAGLADLLGF